jgi:hypothetical protein
MSKNTSSAAIHNLFDQFLGNRQNFLQAEMKNRLVNSTIHAQLLDLRGSFYSPLQLDDDGFRSFSDLYHSIIPRLNTHDFHFVPLNGIFSLLPPEFRPEPNYEGFQGDNERFATIHSLITCCPGSAPEVEA